MEIKDEPYYGKGIEYCPIDGAYIIDVIHCNIMECEYFNDCVPNVHLIKRNGVLKFDLRMSFREYQEKAKETAIFPHPALDVGGKEHELNYLPFVYPVMGLTGEVGEISNKLKKIIRDKDGVITEEDREDYGKEIGDILWYVSALATSLDLDLDKIAEDNIKKLASRKERGKIQGSGDNR